MMKPSIQPALSLLSIGAVSGVISAIATAAPPVLAQVDAVFDGTMGPAGRLNGGVVLPSQGTTNGTNLFHSFSRFNVFNGATVTFNSGGANNIVTRVTGNTSSIIDGTLSADANFFFINPSGIIFQDEAQLDINGSFVATTTDGVYGGNRVNQQFNARTGNLLTFNGDPSGFLASQATPGDIQVNGSSLSVNPGENLMLLGGNVTLNSATLTAPGGFIEIGSSAGNTPISLAPNASFDNAFTFGFEDNTNRLNVSVGNNSLLNVAMTNDAVATGITSGGSLRITAENITVNRSTICGGIGTTADGACGVPEAVNANEAGNLVLAATGTVAISGESLITNRIAENSSGTSETILEAIEDPVSARFFGSIVIGGDSIQISNSTTSTSTFGNGNAGAIFLLADGNIQVDNSGIFSQVVAGAQGNSGIILAISDSATFNRSSIISSTAGSNSGSAAGGIGIQTTGALTFSDDSLIFSNIESGAANGIGGAVVIEAGSLKLLSGSQVQTLVREAADGLPAARGNAGRIEINVEGATAISGNSRVNGLPSGIFSIVGEGAEGNGGVIELSSGSLAISGGRIGTDIFGIGNAGVVLIAVDGTTELKNGGIISSVVGSGGVTSAPTGSSFSGDEIGVVEEAGIEEAIGAIFISTGALSLSNESAISTSTFGQGDAGGILIFSEGTVFLTSGSAIASAVDQGLQQSSGIILIIANDIGVVGGSIISVENQGLGEAGNLFLLANELLVVETADSINSLFPSQLSATTEDGSQANISIFAPLLVLAGGSEITTDAGVGDGGNITILSSFVYGTPFADNNIVARAIQGRGGNITIQGALGIEFTLLRDIDERIRDFGTSNDITAASEFGINGSVTLNALQIDPVRESEDLPQDVVDVSRLVAQGCAAGSIPDVSNIGELFIRGRGGLPQNPEQVLGSGITATDLVTLDSAVGASSDAEDAEDAELIAEPPATESAADAVVETNDTDNTNAVTSAIAIHRNPGMQAITTPVIEAQGFQLDKDGTVQLVSQAADTMPAQPVFRTLTCRDIN
ncbi:MAG: two-partner secretion domain-containing protein [Thainema sp.]